MEVFGMRQRIHKDQLCPLAALLIQPEKEFGKQRLPGCNLAVFHQRVIRRDEHVHDDWFPGEWGDHLG